ncbi:hypothetical protein O6H91_08G033600 [Diphasiastrum complanatum]|uniref:Uncharacterized protein n=1 Tax=Diphasiastrum complanatum TaxID=34168 RepID=A0ACC2CWD0_DIPCM|nr:hypothetical protein O6H91_08G033600 [Diphasiastrum complanatum]
MHLPPQFESSSFSVSFHVKAPFLWRQGHLLLKLKLDKAFLFFIEGEIRGPQVSRCLGYSPSISSYHSLARFNVHVSMPPRTTLTPCEMGGGLLKRLHQSKKSGRLPLETASLLSQVSFHVLIPCFLMSKVSKALSPKVLSTLLILPLIGIFQVLLGALLGKFCYQMFCRNKTVSLLPVLRSAPHEGPNNTKDVSSYTEIPLSRSLMPKRESLVMAACAFGNSVTLPLVLLSGILPSEEISRAAGYLSLYLVGWSPALWTFGYQIITSDQNGHSALVNKWTWGNLYAFSKRILNPPLLGVLVGILIGATPLSHLFFPGQDLISAETTNSTCGWGLLYSFTRGILSPLHEAASLLGSGTLSVQMLVLACSLAASFPSVHTKFASSHQSSILKLESGADQKEQKESTSSSKDEPLIDQRCFLVTVFVRIIIMPLAGIFITDLMHKSNLLPVDPVCRLTIMVLAAMPSAQNLVVLCQLHVTTRPLAGIFAALIMSQYLVALVPLTLWMAIFLSIIAGPR